MALQNPHGPKSCQHAQDTKPGELLSLPNPPKLLPLQFKPRSCRKTDCDPPRPPKGKLRAWLKQSQNHVAYFHSKEW